MSVGVAELFGTEFGRQDTDNFRQTGFFTSLGADVATVSAPLDAPTIALPLEFRQNATDADNDGVTTIASAYAQDQLALSAIELDQLALLPHGRGRHHRHER